MSLVNLIIDGKKIAVEKGKTLLDAARKAGIKIPTLCYHEKLLPYGACRLCMVEIFRNPKSEIRNPKFAIRNSQFGRLVASCAYEAEEGLEILTKSPRVIKVRKLMIELLMSQFPYIAYLRKLAEEYGVTESRFNHKLSICILCGLCVRYCAEVKKNRAVGFIGRGIERRLAWTPDSAYKKNCAGCFECFSICPTGVFPSNWSLNTIKQLRES